MKQKLSDEGVEIGVAVVKETCNPLADRPVVVARFRADEEGALYLRVYARNRDVARCVEQLSVFEHFARAAVEIIRKHFAVVRAVFVASYRDVADFTARGKLNVFCVNLRGSNRQARIVVDVTVNADGFAVVIFNEICPGNLHPCGDVVGVETEKLIHHGSKTFGNLNLERVRRERSYERERKRLFAFVNRVFGRHRVRRTVDVDRRVFCKQGKDDLVNVDIRFHFAETEVACVDVERTARVVNTEKDGTFGIELLARQLDHKFTDVASCVDAGSAEQIVHDRSKVKLSRNAQFVVDVHLRIERHRGFLYVFFFVSAGCGIEIEQFARIAHRDGTVLDCHERGSAFVVPVRALSEHEFRRAFVRFEVDAESKVERKEGIFEYFDVLIGVFTRLVEIIDAAVFQADGKSVERSVKVDVVADCHKHAEFELSEIEPVVERNADAAVEIGVFKGDGHAVDVEKFENLIEQSRNERHFDCVIADIQSVDYSRDEAEHARKIKSAFALSFCGECGSSRAALSRQIDVERSEQFVDIDFYLVDADAKHVKVGKEPSVLQIERDDFFAVRLLRQGDHCGGIEQRSHVESARKVEIRADVQIKSAVDVAKLDEQFDKYALERTAEFHIGQIHFELSKRAFERFNVNGKPGGKIDVQQIGVELSVFEYGQIRCGICVEFRFEIGEVLVEAHFVRNRAEQQAYSKPRADERMRSVHAEIRRDVNRLGLLRAVVFIDESGVGDGNLCSREIAGERKREYAVENCLRDVHLDLHYVEDIAVHRDVDLVENGGNKSHNVRRIAVRGCFGAMLNHDVRVLNKLIVLSRGCSVAVDCALYRCKELVGKVVDELIDVYIVDFELRAAIAEHAACVEIQAFSCAVVVSRDAFCFVSTAHFESYSRLCGVFGVDDALKDDGQFHPAFCEIYILFKQRRKRCEHIFAYVVGDEIGDESAERTDDVVDGHGFLREIERKRNLSVKGKERILVFARGDFVVKRFRFGVAFGDGNVVLVAVFERAYDVNVGRRGKVRFRISQSESDFGLEYAVFFLESFDAVGVEVGVNVKRDAVERAVFDVRFEIQSHARKSSEFAEVKPDRGFDESDDIVGDKTLNERYYADDKTEIARDLKHFMTVAEINQFASACAEKYVDDELLDGERNQIHVDEALYESADVVAHQSVEYNGRKVELFKTLREGGHKRAHIDVVRPHDVDSFALFDAAHVGDELAFVIIHAQKQFALSARRHRANGGVVKRLSGKFLAFELSDFDHNLAGVVRRGCLRIDAACKAHRHKRIVRVFVEAEHERRVEVYVSAVFVADGCKSGGFEHIPRFLRAHHLRLVRIGFGCGSRYNGIGRASRIFRTASDKTEQHCADQQCHKYDC